MHVLFSLTLVAGLIEDRVHQVFRDNKEIFTEIHFEV